MTKYSVYSQLKESVESDLIYICTCDSKDMAKTVVKVFMYRDNGGKDEDNGLFDYYIKKIEV